MSEQVSVGVQLQLKIDVTRLDALRRPRDATRHPEALGAELARPVSLSARVHPSADYLFPPLHLIYPITRSTMADVEMKVADDTKEKKKEEEKKPIPPTPVAEIKANVVLIDRAVSTLEPRFTHRVLRSLAHLRKKLDFKVLRDAISQVYATGAFQLRHIYSTLSCTRFFLLYLPSSRIMRVYVLLAL